MKPTISPETIISTYKQTESIKSTARTLRIGEAVVRRTLITARMVVTDRSREISAYKASGKTDAEIANLLGISIKGVRNHLPYIRGSYAVGEKTKNAKNIARWRNKRNPITDDSTNQD